jgi:hypothetical protein
MKKTITLFILAVMTGLSASADIPAGYYTLAVGKSD